MKHLEIGIINFQKYYGLLGLTKREVLEPVHMSLYMGKRKLYMPKSLSNPLRVLEQNNVQTNDYLNSLKANLVDLDDKRYDDLNNLQVDKGKIAK